MAKLSDKALSIFVFAAYHELVGGQPISSVAEHDDSGHGADPGGVAELREQGSSTSTATASSSARG